jgi:hypothetical protein
MGLGKDLIQLLDGQALDRILLVDINRKGINGDRKRRRMIAVFFLERSYSGLRIGRDIGPSCDTPSSNAEGAVPDPALDVDLHVWVQLAEIIGPVSHQIPERVGSN